MRNGERERGRELGSLGRDEGRGEKGRDVEDRPPQAGDGRKKCDPGDTRQTGRGDYQLQDVRRERLKQRPRCDHGHGRALCQGVVLSSM